MLSAEEAFKKGDISIMECKKSLPMQNEVCDLRFAGEEFRMGVIFKTIAD
jgi:hypothetical protein